MGDEILLKQVDYGSDGHKEDIRYIPEIAKEDFQKAEEEFSELLVKKFDEDEDLGFIPAMYQVVDELEEKFRETDKTITCHAGCNFCCHQLVCCTKAEMEEITKFISRMPRPAKRDLLKRVQKEAYKFYQFVNAHQKKKELKKWEQIGTLVKETWRGHPCPYLSPTSKCCSIYPARPIDCRVTRTREVCGKVPIEEATGIKPYRMLFDLVATNTICDEDRNKNENKELVVVPLLGWPVSPEFMDFFFIGKKWERRKK